MLNFASNDPLSEVVDILRTNNPLVNKVDYNSYCVLTKAVFGHTANPAEDYVMHFNV